MGTVLFPIFLAVVVAYLLHPLVGLLTKFKLKRSMSILLVYIVFFGGLFLFGWLLFPLLTSQVREMMARLPQFEEQLRQWYLLVDHRIEQLPTGIHLAIDRAISNFESNITQWMTCLVTSLSSLPGHALTFIVVPFFAFFLLNEIEIIEYALLRLIPRKRRKLALRVLRDIDRNLGEYIRGQLLVCFFVGLLAFTGYYLLGLPYALLLGVIVGIMNIIPYFGPILGTVMSGTVALFTEPRLIIWIVLINILIQIIEGNFLNPYIVGKRLHLHPMLIIIVLLVGAEIGGILGLLFAVPLFVIFKVIVVNTLLNMYKTARIDKLPNE
jgi:predicted PurR-regulated permease PerM